MTILTQHFWFLSPNLYIPTCILIPFPSKASLCLWNTISMNSSQMKNEEDPKRGKLEYMNLDIFNKIKYSGSIWKDRGMFLSPNRQLKSSLIN